MKHSRPKDEEMKMYDASGKLHLHHPQQKPEDIRPEIDRTILRQILLDACPANAIKWDHALSSAMPFEDDQRELSFANGLKIVCDFLVGVDSANSLIRSLVFLATFFYYMANDIQISPRPFDCLLSEPEGRSRRDRPINHARPPGREDARKSGQRRRPHSHARLLPRPRRTDRLFLSRRGAQGPHGEVRGLGVMDAQAHQVPR
ncbi:hypothetical protein L226DRAFT_111805 [Lentinus tigrinus ALCF2SS1-7]|uniref:FAD-binding domain-containing protein n=1 Tax=Lentinus tigrinus ALCF2SS1-6 TaxID=1328759 RepID=A0A5C2S1A0_9APHY|nr:hypothetical protein L227DRAFT_234830 [Lentinus tigrinus ALCF2SS1-6]RPD73090.1 hypothetical protein L226DRAFT_111805 [Lentinus tigrinus ALCF2SS1-7]